MLGAMDRDKRKRKAFYRKNAQQNKHMKGAGGARWKSGSTLQPGMSGLIFTCNNEPQNCLRDAYRMLNEAAAALGMAPDAAQLASGTLEAKAAEKEPLNGDGDEESEPEDVAEALARERAVLVPTGAADSADGAVAFAKPRRRFSQANTGVNSCLFVRVAALAQDAGVAPPINALAAHLFASVRDAAGQRRTRFVLRCLPVLATCRADLDDIVATFRTIWPPAEATPQGTFSVQFKVRNFDKLSRDDVISGVAAVVHELTPQLRVCHAAPGHVIAVNVMRSVACLSLLVDFQANRKYNLQEVMVAAAAASATTEPVAPDEAEKDQVNDNATDEAVTASVAVADEAESSVDQQPDQQPSEVVAGTVTAASPATATTADSVVTSADQ